jgi:crotonobetainyl-CoA:carnitine CoA-transferase CaiB-like acyl-CoA transferase
MSDTPVQYRTTPPQLGQHTREVLREVLGLSEVAMNELQQQGVLG